MAPRRANLQHPALTIGVRVWQLVWSAVLVAASAAVVGLAGAPDLYSVNFGICLGAVCGGVATLYIIAAKFPGGRLHSALPGLVDGVVSTVLGVLCIVSACAIGNGLTVTCRFVSSVMGWARALGIGEGAGNPAESMCAAAQLATAAAVLLFVSFIVTATFGFMGMVHGQGLVTIGGGSGAPAAPAKEVQIPAAAADAADKA